MMAKKAKRPSWFKLWLHHRSLIDAVPDDVAGRAIKAALNYFATGEVTPLGQLETVVFASIKSDVDDAHADYLRDVENGKKGGRPKLAEEEKPPVRVGTPPLPTVTEREGDGERDGEEKSIKADKPKTRLRFTPPTVDEVKKYCQEQGLSIDAERFVDHYESNGWMVGRSKMKDWKAAVRNWSRKEKSYNGKTGSEKVWPTIGTTI
jgi:hypothetical protein